MELSIDTASELASIALSREGRVIVESTWRCRRNHTVELLPAIDRLLAEGGVEKGDLTAVFVCAGPGMYTGLRVGISVAQGVARALGLPALAVGRLELDAYPHSAGGGPVVAVHRAGRSELAWASYRGEPWREMTPPRLSYPEALVGAIEDGAVVVGEVDEELAVLLEGQVTVKEPAAEGRARTLAVLGFARLTAGETAEPALLRPIYLRPPAIGPQGTAGRRRKEEGRRRRGRSALLVTDQRLPSARAYPNATMSEMPMERTLILIKPDAMQRGLAGEIISRLERRGLRVVGMRLFQMDEDLARRHYAEHEGKGFFEGLIAYITASPIIAAVFEGTGAVEVVRRTMGSTNPSAADAGTIRGDLAVEMGRNLIHGSDSLDSAKREIELFFDERAVHSYPRDLDRWVFETPD